MMIRSHCYWVSKIVIISYSLIINVLASATPHVCRHDQRDALLEFKDEFPIDESNLSLWEMENYNEWTSSWNKSSDCCVWKGVTCDNNSGQVISLDLSLTILNGSLKTNSTLFKHQYLRNLNLMGCHLIGKIPFSLGNLSRLTSVDLSSNKLVGEIPDSIGSLNQLMSLSLEFNGFTGKIPSSIGNLSQLRSFSLEYNNLTGEIPFSLGNLFHLVELTLYVNHLVGELPASIGNLNELVTFSLFRNMLSGNIPVLLVNLTKISQFSLYSNNFTSMLPSNMSAFQDLEYIDVRENSFHGSIPKSLFLNPSLRKVSLSGNQFIGPIEFANTSSSSKLKYLYLDRNRFNGPIPDSISELLNIQILDLSHNNFSGPIPTSISKLVNLISLGLSNNTLEGRVPNCLSRIYSLRLSHNSFSFFENSSHETKIQVLDLSSNSFREPFPLWICNFKLLEFLDLSNNLFSGLIPPCLRNMADSLGELILHNNNFSGTLPNIFVNATKLQYLDVSHNQLEGKLPKSLINCKYLELLNVEGNIMKDNFPSWLACLPSLHVLILKSNDFFGPLYYRHISSGFQSLRIIDISHNGFTGTLPPNYFSNWHEMTTLMNETNEYMMDYGTYRYYSVYQYQSMEMVNKGVEMRFERIRKDWRAIDFSGNKFNGNIPESLGSLKELRLLNLSGNTFTSDIPQRLANLTNLETLDLSRNKLTGQIPQDLGKLSSLSYMNFSHNNLQGIVPRGTQFQRQECSSFSDNPRLHGLEDICGKTHFLNPPLQQPEEFSEIEEHIFNWIAAAIAYGPGVFCGLVFGHIFTSHYHEWFADKFDRRKVSIAR